jgi:CheY-like chemotaxis protein/HPt (histidine-containing phosphotransfer) domain-containing protein
MALGTTVPPRGSLLPAEPLQRPLRVLVVEDNLVNQKLAIRLLEKRGHIVTVAHNGKEALAVLGAEGEAPTHVTGQFDVVLMDLQMPEMDGLEATRRIRAWEQRTGGRLPIIAMTAYAMKSDAERCLAEGMDAHVTKPVKVQELYTVIDRMAAQRESPAGTASASPPAPSDVLDRATALDYVAGDRQLLHELVSVFAEECPKWLAELHRGAAHGDAKQVGRAAHKFRGALGNFGAQRASAAAAELEAAGQRNDLAGIDKVLATLEWELQHLLPVLREVGRG